MRLGKSWLVLFICETFLFHPSSSNFISDSVVTALSTSGGSLGFVICEQRDDGVYETQPVGAIEYFFLWAANAVSLGNNRLESCDSLCPDLCNHQPCFFDYVIEGSTCSCLSEGFSLCEPNKICTAEEACGECNVVDEVSGECRAFPVCEGESEPGTQCCPENGLIINETACCPIGDDQCCGLTFKECVGEIFGYDLEIAGGSINDDVVPPILFINNQNVSGCSPGPYNVSLLNGLMVQIDILEAVLDSEETKYNEITEVMITEDELETEQTFNVESCVFLGQLNTTEFLGLAYSLVDPMTDEPYGYIFVLEDPTELDLGQTSGITARSLQSCSAAVNAGAAAFMCPSGQSPSRDSGCIQAAIAACDVDVATALRVYDAAVLAAQVAYNAAVAIATALKIRKYRKALLICTLVGALTGPLSFAICMARQVLLFQAIWFAAKELAKTQRDNAIQLALEQRDAVISAAYTAAEAAGRGCVTCCDGTDPCCGSEDECCGNEDPCCGSSDPCCGSSNPCCGGGSDCDDGGANGDPHMFTFDNLRYSCQGKGEYTIVQALSTGALVQSRFEKKSELVSLATGMAAIGSANSSVVQMTIPETGLDELQLFIDGVPTPLGNYDDDDVLITKTGDRYTIFFKGSELNVVVRYIRISFRHLSVIVRLPPSFRTDEVRGLMGSPDDNFLNDWMTADGTILPIPTSGLREQNGYDYCRMNWCVKNSTDSLFVYPEAGFDFDFYSGCDDPYPGSIDVSLASDELQELCGADDACLIDGIELGLEGAEELLESELEVSTSSSAARFRADPPGVVVGNAVNVVLTVDATGLEATDVEQYHIYRLSPETLEIGDTPIVALFDSGSGLGNDTVASDLIFTGILATISNAAGESFGFQAVPVIGGIPDPSSLFSYTNLNAVRSFSSESGLGIGATNTTALIQGTITGLVLVAMYSWPADQRDLDTGTEFLAQKVGFACGTSIYMDHVGDTTDFFGRERVDVFLSDAFDAGDWSNETTINFNAGWFGGANRGPASLTLSTVLVLSDNTKIPNGDAVSFAIEPGTQAGCASTLVATASVVVGTDGAVNITVSNVV